MVRTFILLFMEMETNRFCSHLNTYIVFGVADSVSIPKFVLDNGAVLVHGVVYNTNR